MKIWRRIAKLSMGQLLKLSLLFAKRPILILPVFKATKETMALSNALFQRSHNKSNKTNAFRHALWNILICQKTNKIIKNDMKSVEWTQKFADLYEKVTQNEILDETMDLHNNKIGRNLFLAEKDKNTEQIVAILMEMMQKAVKIEQIEDIYNLKDQLVYIVEIKSFS